MKYDLLTPVKSAVAACGGARELANLLGIHRVTVIGWTRVPADRVIQVEAATGIPREQLRPDLYLPERPASKHAKT